MKDILEKKPVILIEKPSFSIECGIYKSWIDIDIDTDIHNVGQNL